jgi:hypothetical protein
MSESEIQKLISIFLGLAILVSSAIFVFSDNLVNSYKSNYEESLNNSSQNNSENSDVKNAFVESVKDLPPSYSTISLNDEFEPSGNLTDDLASYTAREIVKANPNGPQTDESGNQNITIPDVESLTTNFATNALSKINLPDWDKEVNDVINKTKFVDDDSINTLAEYLYNFNEISQLEIIDNNLLNKFKFDTNTSPEIISEVAYEKISNVFNKISNLTVPKKAANFHKNFIKLLVYQKNLLSVYQKINTDPLYVFYNIQKNQPVIDLSLENIKNESEKIKNDLINKNNSSNTTKNKFGFINILFILKIQKANALMSVPSIVHDPINTSVNSLAKTAIWVELGHILMQWTRKIATEILKDQLIHRLVQQTIRWIQGGGKPQFITDWKKFLSDSASAGAMQAISEIYPRICRPFQVPIQIAFQNQSVNANIYNNQVACTLGNVVNNLKEFYNNFKYGSWIAYGQVLNPQNNLWGSLIIANDIIAQKAAQKKEAGKNDAQASKGFLSMKRCVKGQSIPCEFNNADERDACDKQYRSKAYVKPFYKTYEDGSGTAWYSICDEDGWENTTPGALLGDITSYAVGNSPIARIVNAQDITALVSALVNSGLNKLILAGQKGLTSLFNGGSSGGGGETSPNQNAVTDPNDPCFGEIIGSESYNDCRSTTEGGGLYKTDTGQQQITLLQQARSVLKQLQDNVSSDNEWLSTASSTQIGLQKIGGCSDQEIQTNTTTTQTIALCPNLATEACNLNNKIEELKIKTTAELSTLQQSIQNIEAIITELSDSKELTIQRLNEINQELSRYNDPSINAPAERLSKLKELQSAVNENISGSQQCQTPLPQL